MLGKIENGPPQEQRSMQEMAVYRLLEQLEIPFSRLDHAPVMTAADGACDEIDAALKIPHLKNLFLRNSDKSRYFLVMMPAKKRLDFNELALFLSTSRLAFGDAEQMEEFLGLKPGAVSILGLMNDVQNRVQLVMDARIASLPAIGCHPCVNTTTLRLATQDVLDRFLKAVGHTALLARL